MNHALMRSTGQDAMLVFSNGECGPDNRASKCCSGSWGCKRLRQHLVRDDVAVILAGWLQQTGQLEEPVGDRVEARAADQGKNTVVVNRDFASLNAQH